MKTAYAPVTKLLVTALLLLFMAALPAVSQEGSEWTRPQSAAPLPAPTAPVNDFAGVIDQPTLDTLNKRLIDYQRSTGVEMAVAVVRTTGGQDIFDYSLAVARNWGIGSKGDDNPGILLLIAIDDRKYFTQISRDLEDELPDALAGSIQRQYLVPEFRKANYAKGVTDTIDAYIRTIDQRSSGTAASPTPVGAGRTDEGPGISSGLCCIIILIILFLIIMSSRGSGGGKKGGWGGGSFGGGGSSVLPWIIGSAIGSSLGSGSSSSSDWGGSSGWSGGGSDWGGFGGGGDFGGGGAGGGW